MNAVALYIAVSRLTLLSKSDSLERKWTDLYNLVPQLRQCLSCSVCGRLLTAPLSLKEDICQHYVCRSCVRGVKNIRPRCPWCHHCTEVKLYEDNRQLQVLLQSYKNICEYFKSTHLYQCICAEAKPTTVLSNGIVIPNLSLVELIEEGANFEDEIAKKSYFQAPAAPLKQEPPPLAPVNNSMCLNPVPSSSKSVTKSSNALPPLAVSLPMDAAPAQISANQIRKPPPFKTVSNGSAMYSVMYTGIGNKITIKRKTDGSEESTPRKTSVQALVREIVRTSPNNNAKRKGCRCGNATPTPGKLTCCGQRCPCYVDAKPCVECKCRGCRNPHRSDGEKVIPVLPELACYEIQMVDEGSNFGEIGLSTNRPSATVSNATSPVASTSTCTAARHARDKTSQIIQFATNEPSTSLLELPEIADSVFIQQSPEGSYQVYNLYASNSHSANLHRIHQIPTVPGTSSSAAGSSGTSTTYLLQSPLNSLHQLPELSTTLPQIIMQPASAAPLSPNVITVHQHLNTTTGASITLSPIIVNASSSLAEIFSDEDYAPAKNQASPAVVPTPSPE